MTLDSLHDRAIGLYRLGDLEGAESLCVMIIEQGGDSAVAHHLLGAIRLRQQRAGEAVTSFNRALVVRPDYAEALANRGTALHQLKRLPEALADFEEALAIRPNDPVALNNRGAVLSDLSRLPEALDSCQKALALNPNYVNALDNLGNVLRQMNRPDAAMASFDRALAIAPQSAEARFNRGLTLYDLGRFAEAVSDYDRVIAIHASDAAALFHRGAALYRIGRLTDALASYEKASTIDSKFAEALGGRGMVLLALRRFEDALCAFDQVLSTAPRDVEALNNRGVALLELDCPADALTALDAALAIEPSNPGILYNKGSVLQRLERFQEALANYDTAIKIDPDNPGCWNNRAETLRNLGRFEEALASYDRAVAVRPDYAEGWFNRGSILREMRRPDEALRSYDTALSINSDLPGALSSRANLLWATYRDYDKALRDLERAILIDPDYPYLLGDLLHLRMYGARWDDFDGQVAALDKGVRENRRVVSPFAYQVVSQSLEDLRTCAVLYARDRFPKTLPGRARATSHANIRIGYVSGEFRQQATSFLAAGLYERHDRSRFEIIAFDSGRSDGSAMRKRLETAFGGFVDISALSDAAAAARIQAENIDILVNLNGYFGEARMGVFAHRPAPIQVNYLGFPGTLGADYIDYILADRIVIPEPERAFYSEQVVYLPDCYQVNDSERQIGGGAPSRSQCGLPETGFVFCNFNQSYKLTPSMFAAWMRILKQAEGSVLWLLEGNKDISLRLRQEAAHHGVEGDRLVFAPLVPVERHLARHSCADLFLDSLPCNAHTTASDALWAGLPLVTCRGKAFAGRVAASLLNAIGLPELVTDDLEQYEALSLKLARDPMLLEAIRKALRTNRRIAPLFDTDRYRRNIEAAYTTMWEIHQRGETPRGFSV